MRLNSANSQFGTALVYISLGFTAAMKRLRIQRLHASLFKLRPCIVKFDENQPRKILMRVTSQLSTSNKYKQIKIKKFSQL